jgi:CheY-like chemotaxis protein
VSIDPVVRDRIHMTLEARAAAVIAAADNLAAFATVQQVPLDVLIVDLDSLGDDAYTLMRQVKTFEEERNVKIPAIALTTPTFERPTSRKAFQIYLSEPFEPIELIAVIASLVQRLD